MKKIIKVLFIVFIIYVAICLALFVFGILDENGIFVNYKGYKTVEVPTETESKATIKIPKEWYFTVEEGRVYIKDCEGNIVATEIYEDYRRIYTQNGVKYDNINEISINKSVMELMEKYAESDLVYVAGGGCRLYECDFGENGDRYVFEINVLISEEGDYQLVLLFEDEYSDLEVFEKMDKSHKYPKDFYQK